VSAACSDVRRHFSTHTPKKDLIHPNPTNNKQQTKLLLSEVHSCHDWVLDHSVLALYIYISLTLYTDLLWHTTSVSRERNRESLCVSLRQAVCLHCLRVVCSESDRSAQCAVVRMFVRSIRTFMLFIRVLCVAPLGKALIRLASVDSAEEVRTRSEGLNLVDPLWRVEQWSYILAVSWSVLSSYEYRISETPRTTVRVGVLQSPSTNQGRALPTSGAITPLYVAVHWPCTSV